MSRQDFDELESRPPSTNRVDAAARMLDRAIQKIPSTSTGGGGGDMYAATYDPDVDGVVTLSDNVRLANTTSAPPLAGSGYVGRFHYQRATSGPGTLYFCVQVSGGGYEWIVVGIASS